MGSLGISDLLDRLDGDSDGSDSEADSFWLPVPVAALRTSDLPPLAVLLDTDMPGKLSLSVLSSLATGVALGSTETTDLMGKTRSVVDEFNRSKGELDELLVGVHWVVCARASRLSGELDSDMEPPCCAAGGDFAVFPAKSDCPGVIFATVKRECRKDNHEYGTRGGAVR